MQTDANIWPTSKAYPQTLNIVISIFHHCEPHTVRNCLLLLFKIAWIYLCVCVFGAIFSCNVPCTQYMRTHFSPISHKWLSVCPYPYRSKRSRMRKKEMKKELHIFLTANKNVTGKIWLWVILCSVYVRMSVLSLSSTHLSEIEIEIERNLNEK